MDSGLLIIRVIAGLLIAGHGGQKLLGWFGGNGLDRTAGWFDSIGFRPGRVMAIIASSTEIGAGLLLALGLATPLASAGICGTLAVAIYTHRNAGLWSAKGGFELALLYATCAIGVGLTGAGKFSLDEVFSAPYRDQTGVAVIAMVGALALSGAVIARSRRGQSAKIDAIDPESPAISSVKRNPDHA